MPKEKRQYKTKQEQEGCFLFQFGWAQEGVTNLHKLDGSLERTVWGSRSGV